mgnify:CR=1 FL=1
MLRFLKRYTTLTVLCFVSLFCYVSNVWAVAYTGSVTGDWSNTATWGGSGPPGAGDTVTINDTIVVTVTDARSIGVTPTLGTAITIVGGGTLTVANGGTLTTTGTVINSGAGTSTATLKVEAGGFFKFDSSAVTATPHLAINPGAAKFLLQLAGTSTSAIATIQSTTGTPTWKITSSARDFAIVSDYADIKDADDGANLGIEYIGSSLNTSINHTLFSNCSQLRLTGGAAVDFVITNTSWSATLGNFSLVPRMTASTTGLRTFTNLVLDKRVLADGSITNFNWTGSLLQDRVTLGGTTTSGTATAFSDNLIANGASGDSKVILINGSHSITNNYLYGTIATNPHFIETSLAQTTTQALTIDGNIYHHSGTDGTGNAFVPLVASFSSAVDFVIKNNISLPNAGAKSSGDIATMYGNQTNTTWTIDHNTVNVSGTGADTMSIAQINETNEAANSRMYPANLVSFKNNIAWSGTASQGYKVRATATRGSQISDPSTATSGGATTLTDTTKSAIWTTNQWAAFLVKIISGTGLNQVRTISSNTTTELTVGSAWTTNPDATSIYEIYALDVLTPAKANYNGSWQIASGTLRDETTATVSYSGVGYDNEYVTAGQLPGVNDVDATNPLFVDSTRNIITWDTALGGPGTAANAIAEIAKMNNRSGYNTSYTPAALVAYVKSGFAPAASAYHAASDSVSPSNGWIGAVAGIAGTSGSPFLMMGVGN